MKSTCKSISTERFPCNHRGYCDALGQCICDHGWTHIGDFRTDKGADCDLYSPSLRALYIVNTILSGITLIYFSRVLIARMFKRNDAGNTALALFVMANLCETLYAILKLIDPVQYVVGKSLVITLTLCLCPFFSLCAKVKFLHVVTI